MPRFEQTLSNVTRLRANVLLLEHGLKQKALAARLGMTPRAASFAITGHPRFWKARRKIERYLGEALWSSTEDFARLARAEAVLGLDPMTASADALRLALRERGVKPRARLTSEELFDFAMNYVESRDQEPKKKGK